MKSGEWNVPGGTVIGMVADKAEKKPEAPKDETPTAKKGAKK